MSVRLDTENFRTREREGFPTFFRAAWAIVHAMYPRTCETTCRTRSNPDPVHREDRIEGKDVLPEEFEVVEIIFSRVKMSETCSDECLENFGAFGL